MTNAGYSYVLDPSGADLRRALLVKAGSDRRRLPVLAVGIGGALTLMASVLRLVIS